MFRSAGYISFHKWNPERWLSRTGFPLCGGLSRKAGGVGIDLTTVKGEQGKVCGRMTDKVVAIPVWGASEPAATLSLVLPQPVEAFLNGGVVAGQSTVAQKKNTECGRIGIRGQSIGRVLWTLPLRAPEVDQSPTTVRPLSRKELFSPVHLLLCRNQIFPLARDPHQHAFVMESIWGGIPEPFFQQRETSNGGLSLKFRFRKLAEGQSDQSHAEVVVRFIRRTTAFQPLDPNSRCSIPKVSSKRSSN